MSRKVTVSIITNGERNQLPQLLSSIGHQRGLEDTDLEILVIDNSLDQRLVLPPLDNLSDRRECRLVREPCLGIPYARNRAFSETVENSDYIAFIDDDEQPSQDWLSHLLRTREQFEADAVTGPVLPKFEDPPTWIVRGGFFSKRYGERTGARMKGFSTSNVLISCTAIRTITPWFDNTLAEVGGSDAEFSRRMVESGALIVWCSEAMVWEHISRSRTNLPWLLRRALRIGTLEGSWQADHLGQPLGRMVVISKGILLLGSVALSLPFAAALGRHRAARTLRRGARALGLVLGSIGYLYPEYRRRAGAIR